MTQPIRISPRAVRSRSVLALLLASTTILCGGPARADEKFFRDRFDNTTTSPIFIFSIFGIHPVVTGTNSGNIATTNAAPIFIHTGGLPDDSGFGWILTLTQPDLSGSFVDYRTPGLAVISLVNHGDLSMHDNRPNGQATASPLAAVELHSIGSAGPDGSHGSAFHSGHPGGIGAMGLGIIFVNDGTIDTYSAIGGTAVAVVSNGGKGGDGGTSGFGGDHGGRGGKGGDGGIIAIANLEGGDITTRGTGADGLSATSTGGEGGSGRRQRHVRLRQRRRHRRQRQRRARPECRGHHHHGDESEGIAAVSQGGGGGNGSGGGWFGGSGDGGDGNHGGVVKVRDVGRISTAGLDSAGIYAASIGGNGGTGGSSNRLFVAVGASGGKGGNGGSVEIDHGGVLSTAGNTATALLAQSIGGGGGRGGGAHDVGAVIGVAVGGSGGAGGGGGSVVVNATGSLSTLGRDASAIVAQSIGGGGGAAGNAVGVALGPAAVQVSVGGSGGSGGHGGAATVTNAAGASITTGAAASGGTAPAPVRGDHSLGALVQSIGGGGGRGGNAVSVAAGVNPDGAAAGAAIGIGGSGGSGGDGGAATFTNDGTVATYGRNASGALVQSIGGGGGSGGNAVTVAAGAGEVGGSVSVGIGGSGGSGGNGFTTTATNGGRISTWSSLSAGLIAQSVGGGGGAGGSVVDVAASFGQNAASASVGIGGKGGTGGIGGAVTVTNTGTVETQGHLSHGLVAQSIGGGGGTGGSVHSYAVSVAAGASGSGGAGVSASVAVGGSGGSGGSATAASVTNAGAIYTWGAAAHGILVQSIGGGGGAGGSATTLAVSAALNRSDGEGNSSGGRDASVAVSVGGSGGHGGHGDGATFTASAGSRISTDGDQSDGVLVQSVGGGGGAGGHAQSISVATVVPNGTEASNGVLNALRSRFPDVPWDEPGENEAGRSFSGSVSVGGSGGKGGTGGTSTVNLDGSAIFRTAGHGAHAVVAQSIGGGGGRGGAAFSDAIAGYETYGLAMSIGGRGGSGNHGGTVTVSDVAGTGVSGSISTAGDGSHGIVAQSVGGGGGSGGAAGSGSLSIPGLSKKTFSLSLGGAEGASGDGGSVSVTRAAPVVTTGDASYGILAQSVGGGGGEAHHAAGDGGSDDDNAGGSAQGSGLLAFSLGGAGAAAGHGGTVSVTADGTISTSGALSHGIVAQSIGGGGGVGGSSGGGSFGQPVGLSAHIGGSGGGGGNGGAVTVTGTGQITTRGAHAFGVLAQSVGGGGGTAGASELILGVGNHSAPDRVVTLDSGSSGTGGTVSVSDAKGGALDVSTIGLGAHAIFAQSIGGGGGLALVADEGAVSAQHASGHSTSSGAGGDVTVTSGGTLATSGDHAAGIFAHSAADGALMVVSNSGAAFLGRSTGASGSVTVTQSGSIATSGAGSHGIEARTSRNSGSAIGVTVSGRVTTSGDASDGVHAVNTTGDLPYGGARSTAVLTTVHVGAGGSVAVSGAGATGIYAQDSLGRIAVNVDGMVSAGGGADSAIDVEGAGLVSISRSGSVTGDIFAAIKAADLTNAGVFRGRATVGDYQLLAGGTHYIPIDFLSPYDIGASASTIGAVAGTVRPYLVSFGRVGQEFSLLEANQAFSVDLGRFVHPVASRFSFTQGAQQVTATFQGTSFAGAGLTGNGATLAAAADGMIQPWLAGGAVAPADANLEALLLDAANAETAEALDTVLANIDASSHYRTTQDHAAAGAAQIEAMMSCSVWGGAWDALREGECTWLKATGGASRNRVDGSDSTQAGVSLGRQFAIGDSWRLGGALGIDATRFSGATSSSEGSRLHAGMVLKYSDGPWLAAAALSGSFGWADATRTIQHSGGQSTALSEHRSAGLAARLRAARLFEIGGMDLMPMVDFDAAWIHDYGYHETGAGALNLSVAAQDHLLFDLHPRLRFGTQFEAAGGVAVRPYLEAGVKVALNDLAMRASLADATAGGGTLDLTIAREDFVATFATGLSLDIPGGLDVKLRYEGEFGDETRTHRGSVKFSVPF